METEFHSSTSAAWMFLESIEDIILKRDSIIIHDANFTLLSSIHDKDDWVAVLVRCIAPDGSLSIFLCDLLCMADAKAQTFVDTTMCLYQRNNVNVCKLVPPHSR